MSVILVKAFSRKQREAAALARIVARQRSKAAVLERGICATFAGGSVSLQQGHYITQKDMDDLQADLSGYFLKDRHK